MARNEYAQGVFINCPFDSEYKPLFEAIAFAVLACGFRPRCALEIDDSSEVRIDKIFKIIAECKYGIHDISRTEVTSASGLPRFNMPLELGMFLATKRFGAGRQRQKVCLILDSMPYRYQQFISDIAGQEVEYGGSTLHPGQVPLHLYRRKPLPKSKLWHSNCYKGAKEPFNRIPGIYDVIDTGKDEVEIRIAVPCGQNGNVVDDILAEHEDLADDKFIRSRPGAELA